MLSRTHTITQEMSQDRDNTEKSYLLYKRLSILIVVVLGKVDGPPG